MFVFNCSRRVTNVSTILLWQHLKCDLSALMILLLNDTKCDNNNNNNSNNIWSGLFRWGSRDLRLCYFVVFRLILASVCRNFVFRAFVHRQCIPWMDWLCAAFMHLLWLVVLAFSSVFADLDLAFISVRYLLLQLLYACSLASGAAACRAVPNVSICRSTGRFHRPPANSAARVVSVWLHVSCI